MTTGCSMKWRIWSLIVKAQNKIKPLIGISSFCHFCEGAYCLCLRCEEVWTASCSPCRTGPTPTLSLRVSPRGALLRLSTASSRVSLTTSTTGICLRASEEIRWEEVKKGKYNLSSARLFFFVFVFCSDLPQHVVGWRGSTYPHGFEFTIRPSMCVLWLLSQQDGVKCLSTIQLLRWPCLLLAGDCLWRGTSLHSPLWAFPALTECRQSARCGSPRKRYPPGILPSDKADPTCSTNSNCNLPRGMSLNG